MTLSLIISAVYLSSSDCALSHATGVKSDRLLDVWLFRYIMDGRNFSAVPMIFDGGDSLDR